MIKNPTLKLSNSLFWISFRFFSYSCIYDIPSIFFPVSVIFFFYSLYFIDCFETTNNLEENPTALQITVNDEFEYISFTLLVSGLSIISINFCFWKTSLILYHLFQYFYFCMILQIYHSFIPLSSLQKYIFYHFQ